MHSNATSSDTCLVVNSYGVLPISLMGTVDTILEEMNYFYLSELS